MEKVDNRDHHKYGRHQTNSGKGSSLAKQGKVNTSLEHLKEVPLTNNPKLVPLESLRIVHTVIKDHLPKKSCMYH